MKKFFCIAMIATILITSIIPANAAKKKTFDLTVTSFPISYQLYAEILGVECDIRREWISNNQAMIYLNDICFCLVETESKSDLSYITGILFTACPESKEDYSLALQSMFLTVYAFDSYLGIDFTKELITNTLPKIGKYTSAHCTYQYSNNANVYMLTISPR